MNAIDREKVLARFWAKVNKTETCWLWTGARTNDEDGALGYGSFYGADKKMVRAHRFAYEMLVGAIPDGLTLDHVKARGCVSTLCVNPAHLEPVSHRENVLRGVSPSAAHAIKTHCPKGHPYSGENLRVGRRGRHCRACGIVRCAAMRAAGYKRWAS